MKKLSIVFAVISLLTLNSCKKEYTCRCTTDYIAPTLSDIWVDYGVTASTKSKAQESCDLYELTTSINVTTCEIK